MSQGRPGLLRTTSDYAGQNDFELVARRTELEHPRTISPKHQPKQRSLASMLESLEDEPLPVEPTLRERVVRLYREKSHPRHVLRWMRQHPYLIVLLIAVNLVVLTLIHFRGPLEEKLRPLIQKANESTFGPLVPIALLVIVSFPPLAGHELIGGLCGVVFGVGKGFIVVAIGTFLGELLLWVAARRMLVKHGQRLEERSMAYASLAVVARGGGLGVAIAGRLSPIPPHFVTAIWASCSCPFWVYAVAAFLTLPKQFALVFIGTITLGPEGTADKTDKKLKIAEYVIFGLSVLLSVLCGLYLYRRMAQARPGVRREFRRRAAIEDWHRRQEDGQIDMKQAGQVVEPLPTAHRDGTGYFVDARHFAG
ncbi:uncharacterized protein L969DRAFT_18637 [Mixia osmundae IAM 14324]|uniref:Golgi apparatus membrane protein TVP38 n=1 Tax=Mixia osmundae (strain CBS 9802 / IAM 14324 / JCM 22182 / KY 12970) TaxID=764103 RepID=G7EAC0_MIXOS|nr:uncharacterized protein L969DRAFT_18637 [Mixia osmundae IAM 14324]KEI37839.1 hypothetical protein L969DRAFT_18637 [Mixia osmundae IAM 14324]GAA99780.1 hypothetical protein E5Q_06483 [Mixia osmundae IAM 14324]